MVDFSVQFNIVAFAITAVIFLGMFTGTVITLCTLRRRGVTVWRIIFYVISWIVLLASFIVVGLSVVYRLDVVVLEQNEMISRIFAQYMSLVFDAVIMEILAYCIFGFSIIAIMFIPSGWSKDVEYSLSTAPVDGEGYIMVDDDYDDEIFLFDRKVEKVKPMFESAQVDESELDENKSQAVEEILSQTSDDVTDKKEIFDEDKIEEDDPFMRVIVSRAGERRRKIITDGRASRLFSEFLKNKSEEEKRKTEATINHAPSKRR